MDPQRAWLDLQFYLRDGGAASEWWSEAIDVAEGLLDWVRRPFGLPPAGAIREGFSRESFISYLCAILVGLRERELQETE